MRATGKPGPNNRNRGTAPKAAWSRVPVSRPPERYDGWERRCMPHTRDGKRLDADEAEAWARTRDWWPRSVNERPWSDARNYIWVLKAVNP